MGNSRVAVLATFVLLPWTAPLMAQGLPSSPDTPSPVASTSPPPAPAFSADGLYNLGNAFARDGKRGLAVLSYERAALLEPGNADIEANLATVRAEAQVPAEPRSRFSRFVQAMSPSLAAWLGVAGITLAGSALVSRRFTRRLRFLAAVGVAIGAVLMAFTMSHAALTWPRMHEAVILVDQAAAHVIPAPMGDTAFVLREAESVAITAEHEDFVLVRNRNGLSGWVARADLASVVPFEPENR
jgi:hypothetical protein